MTKQLLVYERATPISPGRHGGWSVEIDGRYGFAADINSMPLMTTEFAAAAGTFPIVFTADETAVMPLAVVGIETDRSLFVEADGRWGAAYVPAFLRRYPFVFSSTAPDTYALCLDEAFKGVDPGGRRGERLFDDAGGRAPLLERALSFTMAVQQEHQRSQAFGRRLKELGLLEPGTARMNAADGTPRTMSGFQCVSRARLKELPGEALKALMADDMLEPIYLHLASLANFDALMRRVARGAAAP